MAGKRAALEAELRRRAHPTDLPALLADLDRYGFCLTDDDGHRLAPRKDAR